MEGIEMDNPFENQSNGEFSDNICARILSRFSDAANEHHLHVCTTVGAMSQELNEQNLPLKTLTYFGATCSSLHRLSTASETETPGHVVDALVTILSLVISEFEDFNDAVLRKEFDFLKDTLMRVLRLKSIGPNGIVPGLKCVSRLLTSVRENVNWENVAQLYGVLVGSITDDRTKVRKQSHVCLQEVLMRYQMSALHTPLLASASENLTKVFERFLLLAGGSNSNASEGPKGAQEVLYVLDALKCCLPYLSSKSSTSILKYFKSLLELKQPLVTRRITDALNAICLNQSGEFSSEALLDLLCSLATSVSANESSADGMTFTARLLDIGMRRVYSLNRKMCVVKLPIVFSALGDILASEHEEALIASMQAYKSLIQTCIDESLIKQGVDQVISNESMDSRKMMPTIIEKLCATVGSLLDYHYSAVWDMSFQVVAAMFDKLGQYSSYFLRGVLKSLADMQELPDEDFPFRKQLHECVGSALRAMGPETFLNFLPLNLDAQDLSEANLWLFPILKQYIVGAQLSFFKEYILHLVGDMKQKSKSLEQKGRIYSARSADGIIYSLWSLLPSFCNYPLDTAQSFKDLEKVLSSALREEPDVCGIICSSLQILIQQNKSILEAKDEISVTERSISEERAISHYDSQVAADNLSVLRSSAHELLSVLSKVFSKSSKDTSGSLQRTIGELASISEKQVVARLFRTTMQKLLKVTQEAGKAESSGISNSMQVDDSPVENSLSLERAQLFDLAGSLLPGLDAKEINLLFVAIKPALKDAEGLVQKKAYKVLSIILKYSDEFISRNLEELLNLMIEVLPSCHFSAKRHRLDSLYFLIVHVSKDASEQNRQVITSFLTEIILALKETNKRTRNRAYDIIVQIGHSCGDDERGDRKENLHHFFNMVAGGLAGETPHMISAAVKGLARLSYEFGDLISAAYNILPSTFLLLQRKNREIIKASLGLLKVMVAKSQAESLETHLKGMVEGLLNWQGSSKNHFKAKVKLLLEMLVKKCGLEAVKGVVPKEHMKLLTNIRKMKERRERKLASNAEESRSQLSKATTSRLSRWNHTRIFSDFGDGEMENSDADDMDVDTFSRQMKTSMSKSRASSQRSKRIRKSAKSLQEDLFDQVDDEPLDLLDRRKTRSALRSSNRLNRKSASNDEVEIDAEGRLVIQESGKKAKTKREMTSDGETDLDRRSQANSHVSSLNSQKAKKRRKTSESGWAYTGNEYASKKASGDVKRKDKLEPYAYWPLDRKMLSKRPEHKAAARKGMTSVVKMAKKLEGKSVSNALSMKGLKQKKAKKKSTQQRSR